MKTVRRGQLIVPFGIGQIINFPGGDALMTAGLDFWDETLRQRQDAGNTIDRSLLKISDEQRLAAMLGVDYFLQPFPYVRHSNANSGDVPNLNLSVPAIRFPTWHYCSRCGSLKRLGLHTAKLGKCSNPECGSNYRPKLQPVRFIAACEDGHVHDFPFSKWVHRRSEEDCQSDNLKYKPFGGSGSLKDIKIECLDCGAWNTLAGALKADALKDVLKCKGGRPWVGKLEEDNACSRELRGLIRSGSNVYYPIIRSAIFLPQNNPVDQVFDDNFRKIKQGFDNSSGTDKAVINFVLGQIYNDSKDILEPDYTFEDFKNSVHQRYNSSEITEEQEQGFDEFRVRHSEFQFILSGYTRKAKDFKSRHRDIALYKSEEIINSISDIILLERLRETRVFTGFSRVTPNDGQIENKLRMLTEDGKKPEWLPAIIVYGEGIFLKFRDDKIQEWANQKCVSEHFQRLRNNINAPNYQERLHSPQFVMIHTLAHILINQLCFSCGYGSSALRERLYVNPPEREEDTMNALLIYTSSGDSEGSLGGLVRQGTEQFFPEILQNALETARWCSADPVCMDVGIKSGQGTDSVNGAACHNCALVPETSCEERNMFLDRALLIGTPDNPNVGFFTWLEERS